MFAVKAIEVENACPAAMTGEKPHSARGCGLVAELGFGLGLARWGLGSTCG